MKVLWPFGVALRGEASNHLKLRWLKTVVVGVEEKACVTRQVGIGKANVSDTAVEVSKRVDDIETGDTRSFRDEPGGCPSIGQVVSGM
jgi:hypothetical protein